MPRIYIAGHRGMVGSALYRTANSRGYHDIITRTHKQMDLLDPQAVDDFLKVEKPDWVFLAAAKVGGIYANNTYRADFLLENLKIQNNIIESAFK
ncbi:MAG TPA: NAD-dependent epimerase/dehydratase family protein, partial [Gammaproteobacteria bacterium]|nr:NAD-dependent epimerase/dehydratase family protein [Gammaproteobacteria bacterium]